MNKEILSWLTSCPASDINFISQLADADLETCEAALKSRHLSKLARQKIESRIKKLNKQQELKI